MWPGFPSVWRAIVLCEFDALTLRALKRGRPSR